MIQAQICLIPHYALNRSIMLPVKGDLPKWTDAASLPGYSQGPR